MMTSLRTVLLKKWNCYPGGVLLCHKYLRVVEAQSVGAWKTLSPVNKTPENPCGSWYVIGPKDNSAFKT